MDAYIFQAALLCNHCAMGVCAVSITNPDDRDDSDHWPQGPYSDGGGEADSPQHCDHCGTFLANPLTGDGESYVRDAWREYVETGRGRLDTLAEWKAAYEWVWMDFESITLPMMQEGWSRDAGSRAVALAVS